MAGSKAEGGRFIAAVSMFFFSVATFDLRFVARVVVGPEFTPFVINLTQRNEGKTEEEEYGGVEVEGEV